MNTEQTLHIALEAAFGLTILAQAIAIMHLTQRPARRRAKANRELEHQYTITRAMERSARHWHAQAQMFKNRLIAERGGVGAPVPAGDQTEEPVDGHWPHVERAAPPVDSTADTAVLRRFGEIT